MFCAPSLHGESFGVVLLEAMAAQTPVVASDIPGYARVAREAATPSSCRQAIRRRWPARCSEALTDRRRADELVASAEQRAAEFSMDALAERYRRMYESVR